ncbi:hypothetical protein [Streptomyces sp. S.PNR 29]|uniref:hypothetical protein n=1 Tax=Streptomyces sp. S.PNR 29 TaxID=2973805 RepID=UPI0025B1E456|nr:hypothetical protein [Streptomyces sp. S.PNR 29]MDN0193501.1 hypothetical protein [Streptomyces sp. S.PNR 29]
MTSYRPDREVFDDVTFPRIIDAAAAGRAPTRRAADFYRGPGFHETAAYLKWSTG